MWTKKAVWNSKQNSLYSCFCYYISSYQEEISTSEQRLNWEKEAFNFDWLNKFVLLVFVNFTEILSIALIQNTALLSFQTHESFKTIIIVVSDTLALNCLILHLRKSNRSDFLLEFELTSAELSLINYRIAPNQEQRAKPFFDKRNDEYLL